MRSFLKIVSKLLLNSCSYFVFCLLSFVFVIVLGLLGHTQMDVVALGALGPSQVLSRSQSESGVMLSQSK